MSKELVPRVKGDKENTLKHIFNSCSFIIVDSQLLPNFNQQINNMKPTVTIEYCPKCGWLLRAAYMAQELLTTFNEELKAVTLQPSEVSGDFHITMDGKKIFDRKEYGGFPEIKELKQLVRDVAAPGKSLGHSDTKPHHQQ